MDFSCIKKPNMCPPLMSSFQASCVIILKAQSIFGLEKCHLNYTKMKKASQSLHFGNLNSNKKRQS